MSQKVILLFGAGFVTTTVVEYLTRRPENKLIIANRSLANAQQRAKQNAHNPENVECVEFDIETLNEETHKTLEALVARADIVISLVPYLYHVVLAKVCIEKKVNMITTSYISPAMRELNDKAIEAGIVLMNEIGVDPGIDHIAAVKIITAVRELGGKINSFTSWCGGLPALEDMAGQDNPLKYKFSWSPRGVLNATNNTAKYLMNGETVAVNSDRLMLEAMPLQFPGYPQFDFEGYPNRDSTPYVQEYNIPETKTCLRGTLRFRGFCKLLDQLKHLGLTDATSREDLKSGNKTVPQWNELFQQIVGAENSSEASLAAASLKKLNVDENTEEGKKLVASLKWMGLFDAAPVTLRGTVLDCFSELLLGKMYYAKGERDLIYLRHTFDIEYPSGKKEIRTATLLTYGDKNVGEGGHSSMAKTTGLPCAIGTQLILDGVINRKGVFGPMFREINDPIEEGLLKEGIKVEDEIIPVEQQ